MLGHSVVENGKMNKFNFSSYDFANLYSFLKFEIITILTSHNLITDYLCSYLSRNLCAKITKTLYGLFTHTEIAELGKQLYIKHKSTHHNYECQQLTGNALDIKMYELSKQ